MKKTKAESGFTLIEVVASIVIITIVLLSFSQIFIQTNKTAAYNNEKLVTINLADGILAKIQSSSYTEITNPSTLLEYFVDSPKQIDLNGRTYSVTYSPSQSRNKPTNSYNTEVALKLIRVVVTVTSPDGKTKGSSEGYVLIE